MWASNFNTLEYKKMDVIFNFEELLDSAFDLLKLKDVLCVPSLLTYAMWKMWVKETTYFPYIWSLLNLHSVSLHFRLLNYLFDSSQILPCVSHYSLYVSIIVKLYFKIYKWYAPLLFGIYMIGYLNLKFWTYK